MWLVEKIHVLVQASSRPELQCRRPWLTVDESTIHFKVSLDRNTHETSFCIDRLTKVS